MKKINQYILTHFPLIWNTRFHIMLPVLLLFNLIFFLSGYLTDLQLNNLSDFWNNNSVFSYSMAVLIGIGLLITWLIFYLRHNALKSLLPVSKFYIAKEFCIIFIVFAGLCSFMASNMWGRQYKFIHVTKNIDCEKENAVIALAMNFLPKNADNFSVKSNQKMIEGQEDRKNDYSYLNYSGRTFYSFDFKEESEQKDRIINAQGRQLLITQNKPAITKAINDYLLLCEKYGAEYNINVQDHVAAIFSTPDLKIAGTLIGQGKWYNNEYKYYIEFNTVDRAISKIDDARKESANDVLNIIYYFAIAFTVLLFSFRVTAVKTWLIAFVSSILLIILTGIGFMLIDPDESGIFSFIILLAVITLIIAIFNILNRVNKQVSGAAFILFQCFLPAFIITVYALIKSASRYNYNYVEEHLQAWNIAGIIFTFLFTIFVMSPLALKWQSNPKE